MFPALAGRSLARWKTLSGGCWRVVPPGRSVEDALWSKRPGAYQTDTPRWPLRSRSAGTSRTCNNYVRKHRVLVAGARPRTRSESMLGFSRARTALLDHFGRASDAHARRSSICWSADATGDLGAHNATASQEGQNVRSEPALSRPTGLIHRFGRPGAAVAASTCQFGRNPPHTLCRSRVQDSTGQMDT